MKGGALYEEEDMEKGDVLSADAGDGVWPGECGGAACAGGGEDVYDQGVGAGGVGN